MLAILNKISDNIAEAMLNLHIESIFIKYSLSAAM